PGETGKLVEHQLGDDHLEVTSFAPRRRASDPSPPASPASFVIRKGRPAIGRLARRRRGRRLCAALACTLDGEPLRRGGGASAGLTLALGGNGGWRGSGW